MFEELNRIKCDIEKKGQFNYVSWTDAWTELKKKCKGASYKIYENESGFPCFFNDTGGMVKVGVTVDKVEHINWMPVMDNYNKAIPKDKITTFEINKSIQRCFVKAIAMHGLGLYVYRGEDLPEDTKDNGKDDAKSTEKPTPKSTCCEICKKITHSVEIEYSQKHYNKNLCRSCQQKQTNITKEDKKDKR